MNRDIVSKVARLLLDGVCWLEKVSSVTERSKVFRGSLQQPSVVS